MEGMSRYSKMPHTAAYEGVYASTSLGEYEEHLRDLRRAREELSRTKDSTRDVWGTQLGNKGRIEDTIKGLLAREDKLKEELEDIQKKIVESRENLQEVEGYISQCTKDLTGTRQY